MTIRFVLLAATALLLAGRAAVAADPPNRKWPAAVESALARAGDNRPQLETALTRVPQDRREGMDFLVANMPDADLRSLSADFLLTNVALAYAARAAAPWGKDIPEDVFLNNVLPYANVDEKRDAWRTEFYDLGRGIVRGCKTPSEAACKLNAELFGQLKLRYSTERKAPNQSPRESIEQGKASCTGLSIVLCDACRAVGVPARLAGTPRWANKRGNHTWVEVWDKGWHFTGACEPDPAGLDRGWFVADVARAKKDVPEHAIYAASFKRTRLSFPLVWAPGNRQVPAENVTDRYTKKVVPKGNTVRVLVRVMGTGRKRVAVPVIAAAVDDPYERAEGTSRGATADANDLLGFDLKPGRKYVVTAGGAAKTIQTAAAGGEQTVELTLPAK